MEENEVIYPIYSDTEEQFDEVAWGSYWHESNNDWIW